jgi:putative inorganic carbon (hco3(-)) transporter
VPALGVANILLTLTLLSTVVWRLRARRSGEDFLGPFRRTSPVLVPLGIFVGLSVLSCFFSTLPGRSLIQLKGFGTFLLLPFVVALLADDEDVEFAVDIWRMTAAYLVLRGLAEYVGGFDNLDARLSGGLSVYMTYDGLLMIFAFVLGSRGLSGAGSRASRAFDLAVAAASVLGIALTLTRSAYLGVAVGAALYVLLARPKLALLMPVAAAVLYLAMPAAVRDRARSTLDRTDESARDRFVMWSAGAQMVKDRPFFGVGPGRVKTLYPVYRGPGYVEPRPGHLHNNLIMTAAETGIPSALAYLWFVGAFLFHGVLLARSPLPPARLALVRGCLSAMAALFVAGMFEYNFGDVEVLMATLVVAALPFAGSRREAQ